MALSDATGTNISLRSASLGCTIDPFGAELASLTDGAGRNLLWNGDPAWWSGRAPILFPVVGMLGRGVFRWRGQAFALHKHGFARRRQFELVERNESSATLRLVDDGATLAVYPFDFELDLRFVLGEALRVEAAVRNRGDGPMPFSFGFHPALRWERGDGDCIRFDRPESGDVWRIDGEGMLVRSGPLAADRQELALDDGLFADDAMILRGLASRRLVFHSAAGTVEVAWDKLPDLSLWTKPGAPFLCIEPWAGFNDPAGFSGELDEKPGIVMLAPGERWDASMTIRVG